MFCNIAREKTDIYQSYSNDNMATNTATPIIENDKTYFIIRGREDFAIKKVYILICNGDYRKCGESVYNTRLRIRKNYPSTKYTIETINTDDLRLNIPKDKIEEISS